MAVRALRFGTDGVRGRANDELTPEFALALGRAAARVLQPASAVVGGDSRLSTPMLEAAFVAGLAAEGVEVIRLGVAPTPQVAFEAARRDAMGAVVSASHNPYFDNGIKVFAVGGSKLPDAVERSIEAELERLVASQATDVPAADVPAADVPAADVTEPGHVHGRTDPVAYVAHLHSALEGRTLNGLNVVVDAAHGAASYVARSVFEGAGASVTVIHDQPDGRNINNSCGATDTTQLQAAVVALGADAGIALDGDADRLIAVDADGAVVDGDFVIATCAVDLAERGELADNTVVVTVMANLGFRQSMSGRGIEIVETPVGDRYVLEALNKGGFSLGGEQSGHVIFPRYATTGDGMLTALILLDVMARSGRSLADLAAASMVKMPQVLINVPVQSRIADVAAAFASEIGAAESELGDRGRILVRASGTEPLVRVMVEADTSTVAQQVAERLADAVRLHAD